MLTEDCTAQMNASPVHQTETDVMRTEEDLDDQYLDIMLWTKWMRYLHIFCVRHPQRRMSRCVLHYVLFKEWISFTLLLAYYQKLTAGCSETFTNLRLSFPFHDALTRINKCCMSYSTKQFGEENTTTSISFIGKPTNQDSSYVCASALLRQINISRLL